jgi:small subunit ribosomal protein S12
LIYFILLASLNQIFFRHRFFKKKLNSILFNRPQIKGVVVRVRITTPRKPNSARRPVVKVLLSNKKQRVAHIPGKGHNLRKHSEVLISGVGARDLPGVHFSCIRGVYDLSPVVGKVRRRSIYGVKRPDSLKKKLRRKFRVS